EIRVLDAIFLRTFAADATGLPGGELTSDERRLLAAPGGATPVRLFDRGVGVSAPGLGRPAIADVVGTGTGNIVVVGRSGSDANSGFVQVYAFAEVSLAVSAPPLLFVDRGERIALVGEATSAGVADFDRDGQGDLVVTTLLSSTSQPPPGVGGITASTLRLLRSGGDATPRFAAPTVIDSRVLTGPGGGGFTQNPEYRIATTADLNADGTPDVGLSIVSESIPPTARGATRQSDFVQLLYQPAPDLGPEYAASFVTRQLIEGLPTGQAYTRPQMFLAAGLRGIGRPDLIYAEQASGSGTTRLRILYNVRTPMVVPLA
ncbi:MAG: VCBS repeat-containing protein, partial [Phycisphaerales bacterium]|nr:VCBS repeat-containing protein [Phycisphaerales bacterium]